MVSSRSTAAFAGKRARVELPFWEKDGSGNYIGGQVLKIFLKCQKALQNLCEAIPIAVQNTWGDVAVHYLTEMVSGSHGANAVQAMGLPP